MQELKYTTLEDIKDFLKTLNYQWNGKISIAGATQRAHIEHFRYSVCLIVKNIKTNKYKYLSVGLTDDYFHVLKDHPKMKYDIINHSIAWQTFLIHRKSKDYARFIYKKAQQDKKELEKEFDYKINLVKKQTEYLEYQKSLKSSALNTIIYNAECKLNKKKILKIDNQDENNYLDT